MLATQMQYFVNEENKRHNLQVELENERSHRMNEMLELTSLKLKQARDKAEIKQQAQKIANDQWMNERTAEINRKNAETNRIQALNTERRNFNDYNLGLQANRIAAVNSQINAWNAESQRQQATARLQSAQASLQSASASQRQAETAAYRATADVAATYAGIDMGWFNAQQNARRNDIEAQRVQLQGNRYAVQNAVDISNAATRALDTVFNGFKTLAAVNSR